MTTINEVQAAQIMGVKRKTLQNMVYSGRLPADYYTTLPNGRRLYYLNKLINNEKNEVRNAPERREPTAG